MKRVRISLPEIFLLEDLRKKPLLLGDLLKNEKRKTKQTKKK